MKKIILILAILSLNGCAAMGTIMKGMGDGLVQSSRSTASDDRTYNCNSTVLGSNVTTTCY